MFDDSFKLRLVAADLVAITETVRKVANGRRNR